MGKISRAIEPSPDADAGAGISVGAGAGGGATTAMAAAMATGTVWGGGAVVTAGTVEDDGFQLNVNCGVMGGIGAAGALEIKDDENEDEIRGVAVVDVVNRRLAAFDAAMKAAAAAVAVGGAEAVAAGVSIRRE